MAAQQTTRPRTHRFEATPATVAYGYYDAAAKPVLTIASGDIIDVDTLLTNTPRGLERAGVKPDDIQPALRAIVDSVKDKGPGGHILTGPVFVEGAEPGDALEVKILSIDLPIAYGYNGCSGFIRENCRPNTPVRIIPLDRTTMTATFAPGIVIPLKPFFGSMGVAPPPSAGRISSNPPWIHAGNLDNKETDRGHDAVHSGPRSRRAIRGRRWPCRAGRWRGRSDGHRDVAPRPSSADGAQGHDARLAARGDEHAFHQHGHRRGPDQGDTNRDSGDD